MKSKDAQIITQVSAKLALKAIIADPEVDLTSFPVYLKSIADAITEVSDELTTEPDTAVVVQASGYQQAVTNLNNGGIAVAPAAPSGDDELWQYFVQNRDEFWDNRDQGDTTISGGSKPDFRAKDLVDKSGRKQGLFLVSRKFGKQAPDYVFEALGVPVPGQQAAVPAATTAAPPAAPNPF